MGVPFLNRYRSSALASPVGERMSGVEQVVNPASFGFDDAQSFAATLRFRRERLKYDRLRSHTTLSQVHKPVMLGPKWQAVRLATIPFVDIQRFYMMPVLFDNIPELAYVPNLIVERAEETISVVGELARHD